MYCSYCGKKIQDGSNFCFSCGKETLKQKTENELSEFVKRAKKVTGMPLQFFMKRLIHRFSIR